MSSQEIPGPVWHENVSHGTYEDPELELFYVYAVVNGHRLNSRVRPLSRMETIHSRLRDFSREEVLRAYGIDESFKPPEPPVKKPWWHF